jgi:arsenical pump membrane protein
MHGRLLVGAISGASAPAPGGSHLHAALAQSWPPFVLVAGLLLIGLVAGRDGLFDAAAARLVGLPGPPVVLLLACLSLVAIVTALLNLDTSAVFLTPVLVKVARRRGLEVSPFLYGSVFMANASSLFLPGSNLTNLLVLSGRHLSGASFFTRMLPMALAAPLITAGGLIVIHRARLFSSDHDDHPGGRRDRSGDRDDRSSDRGEDRRVAGESPDTQAAPARLGLGLWGALLAAALIVVLRNAALAVLALGLLLVARRAHEGELSMGETVSWLGLPALLGLFGACVGLGALARALSVEVLHSAGSLLTTTTAALASVLIDNLPAAVLLSSTAPAHPSALLLGLNIGPNLAVTGSLSALLWWRAAGAAGARPSAIAYSRQGLLLAPIALIGALAVGGGL